MHGIMVPYPRVHRSQVRGMDLASQEAEVGKLAGGLLGGGRGRLRSRCPPQRAETSLPNIRDGHSRSYRVGNKRLMPGDACAVSSVAVSRLACLVGAGSVAQRRGRESQGGEALVLYPCSHRHAKHPVIQTGAFGVSPPLTRPDPGGSRAG